jgi:hypothetical protein
MNRVTMIGNDILKKKQNVTTTSSNICNLILKEIAEDI